MQIKRNVYVPTGNILVGEGEKGLLEFLSIGDYGKDVNLKADFMGLDRPIEKVEHGVMLPLTEKWVITVSTQYGCAMGCIFCDVPSVGSGKNASYTDLFDQVEQGLRLHPEVTMGRRLNIHYARMGEPTWNPAVLVHAEWMGREKPYRFDVVHPVISTMMPKANPWLKPFIQRWMWIKNELYEGDAGLQLSINSTSDLERELMFNGNAMSLTDISNFMREYRPVGRKITLNFAVADWRIEADKLANAFDPAYYLVKLTPMHKTKKAVEVGIHTEGDYTTLYPYQKHEERLKAAGFDVLVFIASKEEDESRITCGNAILST